MAVRSHHKTHLSNHKNANETSETISHNKEIGISEAQILLEFQHLRQQALIACTTQFAGKITAFDHVCW